MTKNLAILLNILVPRFITEYVAFYQNDEGICLPAFPVAQYVDGQDKEPDAVAKVRSFSLLGRRILPRFVSELIGFSEWMQSRTR